MLTDLLLPGLVAGKLRRTGVGSISFPSLRSSLAQPGYVVDGPERQAYFGARWRGAIDLLCKGKLERKRRR